MTLLRPIVITGASGFLGLRTVRRIHKRRTQERLEWSPHPRLIPDFQVDQTDARSSDFLF